MTKHLSTQDVQRYHGRTLSAAEVLSVCAHLSECEVCREVAGSPDATATAYAALGPELQAMAEPAHLSDDCLQAFVDGVANDVDREITESHLEICGYCREIVRDLREIKVSLENVPAAAAVRQAEHPHRRSLVSFLLQAAAVLLIAALGVLTFGLRSRIEGLRSDLDALRGKNEELRVQLAEMSEIQSQLTELKGMLASRTEFAIALNDAGSVVGLDRQGEFVGIESLDQRYADLVKRALAGGRAATPAYLRELAAKDRELMGSGEQNGFRLLKPAGVVVESDRPSFRWSRLDGASSYQVIVSDSNFNLVLSSERLSAPEWTATRPLARGRSYNWSVTAVKDGKEVVAPVPPASQVRFRVLDATAFDELERAKRVYGASHLVMGVLYANAGLLEDAEREFQGLANSNPNSPKARQLLRSVRARDTSQSKPVGR